ncbi:signal peptidase I [Bacillus sp. FSL W8-0102]|uniref:signal peptidase I n=1 Tax=Bacillus sp. FSL W8-0102 TaxID=2978205 RepID=UPI0030F5BC3E
MSNPKSEWLSWVKSILFALIVSFIVHTFLFSPYEVKGESMSPTLEEGNKLIVNKMKNVKRFDIVVFHAPDSDEVYVKRVIGLPGDTVEMKNDVLYINGVAYKEPYLNKLKKQYSFLNRFTGDFTLKEITGKEKVPDGAVFVLGDNRLRSNDSRRFGFIQEKDIIGSAVFRAWPIQKIGVMN